LFAVGNVVIGLGVALWWLFWGYRWVLIGRAICSWVDARRNNMIVQYLFAATEPPLRAIARLLPLNLRYFPIDIAFLVLIALVIFLEFAVAQTIIELGMRLKMGRAL
jgi:uncharacterized protein YggT (Ycf19 family)